ncbi:MAG TPA: chorismate-binding protein, partial [Acidimicrobiia bacterium]|nr:chorismate-binding protein [Acidimicrobiia bacterium]
GRYAGPVGWLAPSGDGEFAIALRCGMLAGPRATLYTGAGLVEGSDPELEFEETQIKLRPMLGALGLS